MLDIIRQRRSVRSYNDRPFDASLKQTIEELLEIAGGHFWNFKSRFALIEKERARREEKVKLGTYGFIKGARYFIAGAVERGERAEVDFGYVMERIVLEMTRLGLGTCWLGGTFNRKEYAQILQLDEQSWIPAILAVGYPADKKGAVERLIRWGAKADNRKPFEELFFDGDFSRPLTMEAAGQYAEALEMVRIGPSASNKQPWRIVKDGKRFHLYLLRTPGYRKQIPSTDLQMIDMGIAMQHFALAAGELNLQGEWQILPDIETKEAEHIVTWVGA